MARDQQPRDDERMEDQERNSIHLRALSARRLPRRTSRDAGSTGFTRSRPSRWALTVCACFRSLSKWETSHFKFVGFGLSVRLTWRRRGRGTAWSLLQGPHFPVRLDGNTCSGAITSLGAAAQGSMFFVSSGCSAVSRFRRRIFKRFVIFIRASKKFSRSILKSCRLLWVGFTPNIW